MVSVGLGEARTKEPVPREQRRAGHPALPAESPPPNTQNPLSQERLAGEETEEDSARKTCTSHPASLVAMETIKFQRCSHFSTTTGRVREGWGPQRGGAGWEESDRGVSAMTREPSPICIPSAEQTNRNIWSQRRVFLSLGKAS